MNPTRYCAGCVEALPARAQFCPACGRAAVGEESSTILDESIGIEFNKELRHITVVFCDLVGSTELSALMDTEEYGELIQTYQHRAVAIARSFGGDVEGYSGDGILFRFGWPQAHDDDAIHAVNAALGIVEAVADLNEPEHLDVRVGVHSGQAVVGMLGGADRRATMAVGETLNVSARLQAATEPGTVIASGATIALAEGRFEVVGLGPLRLRGVPEPVEAFRVLGATDARSRIEVTAARHVPLIGRDNELELLQSHWEGAKAGRGSAVLITGEPGVGKSRLALEVRGLVSEDRHRWVESSCASFTRMSVLRPVVEMIEDTLALRSEPDPTQQLERIRVGLDQAGVDLPNADALIGSLLGIAVPSVMSISSELRLERTIDVGVEWLIGQSRQRPLVLLVEDLHWCDPTTLDALERLLDRVPEEPMLVLLTARTEFTEPWGRPDVVTSLPLRPLEDSDVRDLVATLGLGPGLPVQVVERIVTSAGGIPLYVEEVSRTVLESAVLVNGEVTWDTEAPLGDLEIPSTLQGSLLARLDGLGPAKSVAQVAAVFGRTFRFDLLAEVSGMDAELLARLLDRAVDSGLLLHDNVEQGEYIFKHALIQEVAYESLLRRSRRTIHERVARVLDAQQSLDVTAAPEVVARHFEAAGLMNEAVVHYQSAATRAAEGSGHREAITFLRRGISLARQLDDVSEGRELEVEMQLALGSSLATRSYSDPGLVVAYDRARELCELLGNDVRTGLSLGGLSVFYINHGEIALGAELAQQVLAIADEHHDDTLEVLGAVQLSLARIFQGDANQSLAMAGRALAAYRPARHRILGHRFGTDQGVAAHVFAGWSHLALGHLDRGLDQLLAAVTLADQLDEPFNRVYALAFLATGHCERGEAAETLRLAEEARELAERQGFAFWTGISGVWASAERVISGGDRDAFGAVLEAGMAAYEAGSRGGGTSVLARVAEAAHAAGDPTTAQAVLDMALALSTETGQPWWDSELLRQQARLYVDQVTAGTAADLDDPTHPWSKAATTELAALELADRFGFPVQGVRAASDYADLLQRVGRMDEARRVLGHWYGRCTEGLDTPILLAVREQLATLGG